MTFGVLNVQIPSASYGELKRDERYYVKFQFPTSLCGDTMKTDASKDLEWRFSKDIKMTGPVQQGNVMRMILFEANYIGQDERRGNVAVPLEPLGAGGSIESQDFTIAGEDGTALATVTVKVAWKEGTAPEPTITNEEAAAAADPEAAAAGGGGGGGGGLQVRAPGGGGKKQTPLPSCEGNDYTVRVRIHKAKNLQSVVEDKLYNPRCVVKLMDKTRKSETCKNTNDPTFDDETVFSFFKVPSNFWQQVLLITVVNKCLGPDETIGNLQIDLGTVYRSAASHQMARKWFVLFRSVTEGNVMGYIKLTISVLNMRTDGVPDDEDDVVDDEETEEELIANLVSVPGAAFEEIYLHSDVVEAEGIPKMDTIGWADPYVKFGFGKKSSVTCNIRDTKNPVWKARVMLPLLLPCLASTMQVQLWDYDASSPDDVIGTHNLDVNELIDSNDSGLPMMPARWINFYGHLRSCDADFNKYFKAMANGTKKGVDYRGRLLLRCMGSRNKEIPQLPPVVCHKASVVVTCDVMQLSMIPNSGKYKVRVSCGTDFVETSDREATKMHGPSGNYAVYFGESLRLKCEHRVVVHDPAFPLPEEETLRPEAMEARRQEVWSQLPAIVVHLIPVPLIKVGFGDSGGKDPVAAVVFPLRKLMDKKNNALYLSKAMRLMTNPDNASEGVHDSSPLIQINAALHIPKLSPETPLFRPVPEVPTTLIKDGALTKRVLESRVYHCQQLPAGDSNGLSDPFLRVNWANGSNKTHRKLATLNPNFAELLDIVADTKAPYPDVVIELWDWDLIGRNTFLAKTVVPYDHVVANSGPFWVTTWTDCFGKAVPDCRVLVAFKLHPHPTQKLLDDLKRRPKIRMYEEVGANGSYDAVPIPLEDQLAQAKYKFTLTVIGLRRMRKYLLRNMQAPSVRLAIGGHIAETPKLRGPNPNYNQEFTWTVQLPAAREYLPFLEVSVYDHRLGPEVLAGTAMLDLNDPRFNREQRAKDTAAAEQGVTDRLNGVYEYFRTALDAAMSEERRSNESQERAAAALSTASKAVKAQEAKEAKEAKAKLQRQSTSDRPGSKSGDTLTQALLEPSRDGTAGDTSRTSGSKELADVGGEGINVTVPPVPAQETDLYASAGVTTTKLADENDDEALVAVSDAPNAPIVNVETLVQSALADHEDDMDGASTSCASSEADEPLWFDRYDVDDQGVSKVDDNIVEPHQRVMRIGRVAKKVSALDSGRTTAESVFGPFDDELLTVPLTRGWGSKKKKAGDILMTMTVEKVGHVEKPKKLDDLYSQWGGKNPRGATLTSKKCQDRAAKPFMARVYVLGCKDLAAMDHGPTGNASDPYVVLTLTNGSDKKGDITISCRDQTRYQCLDPDFFFSRELRGTLPNHNTLRVTVMDYDKIGSDEVIGTTEINVEERYYSSRGYSRPALGMEAATDNMGQVNPRGCFGVNVYGSYTERRLLRNETGQVQGSIELWVDLFDFATPVPRPIDIAPPPPVPMELRCVVWNTRDVELTDSAITGEMMTDIYVRCWVDGMPHLTQNTDVHYRSLDGTGNFNWRMVFPFVFEPRTKKIFRNVEHEDGKNNVGDEAGGAASTAGKLKLFQVRREAKKLEPVMKVQIFDNDLFPGTDDFIGETSLNLIQLRPTQTHRAQKSLLDDLREDITFCCNVWPFKLLPCCRRKPDIKDLTLEQRQEHARIEAAQERAAVRKAIDSEVAGKMEVLRKSNQYSDVQLARFERRLRREAKKRRRVNVFQEFLPKREKRSQRLAEDKKHAAELTAETQQEEGDPGTLTTRRNEEAAAKKDAGPPKVVETQKYWFAARGPNGGCRVGDVQLSFQLVRSDAMQFDSKLVAGKGRSEPQALPEPDRPPSSFFWLSSPWKAAVHIFWKNYKMYIIAALVLIVGAFVLYLFLSTGIEEKSKQFFSDI